MDNGLKPVLAFAEKKKPQDEIAKQFGVSKKAIATWRKQYVAGELPGTLIF